MAAEVVSVKIVRSELTAAEVPELRELFGLERLPMGESKVEIEIKGVPTAVVNALRRVVTDELPGRALHVPSDTPGEGFDTALTTEVFMLPQFVNGRIALIPLRPQIPSEIVDGLRLKLDVTNTTASLHTVYSGDFEITEGSMPEPLFNPTFQVCTLQPGKRIVIRGIRIMTGSGRDHGAYIVARRAAYTHLDLPQHSREETHEPGGPAADWSGYKVSSLVANPRHHRLTAMVFATATNPAEVRAVFADACANIKDRLRLIAAAVEQSAAKPVGGAHSRGVQYTVVVLESGLSEGILQVPGETHTIGELLRRAVYEITPEVSHVAYRIIPHVNQLSLQIRNTADVTAVLLRAVQHCVAIFDEIQRGVLAAR